MMSPTSVSDQLIFSVSRCCNRCDLVVNSSCYQLCDRICDLLRKKQQHAEIMYRLCDDLCDHFHRDIQTVNFKYLMKLQQQQQQIYNCTFLRIISFNYSFYKISSNYIKQCGWLFIFVVLGAFYAVFLFECDYFLSHIS